jgi:hypothetical protein
MQRDTMLVLRTCHNRLDDRCIHQHAGPPLYASTFASYLPCAIRIPYILEARRSIRTDLQRFFQIFFKKSSVLIIIVNFRNGEMVCLVRIPGTHGGDAIPKQQGLFAPETDIKGIGNITG